MFFNYFQVKDTESKTSIKKTFFAHYDHNNVVCLLSYLRSKVSIISYLQAAVEFKDRNNDVLQIESKISQHSTYLKFEDTVISYQMIKYPREYQGHLERIADFLLESNVWEEIAEGVKFMDVSGT